MTLAVDWPYGAASGFTYFLPLDLPARSASDEYVGQELGYDGRLDLSSFPASAEDENEAEDWWADRLGYVDPMFSIWIDELDDAGLGMTAEAERAMRD